jgi:hypothetical protein
MHPLLIFLTSQQKVMKKPIFILFLLAAAAGYAQQHFAGINTSSRTGVVNGGINPAEYTNVSNTFEISVLAPSVNASSNKVGFADLVGGEDIEELIFEGEENANLRIDGEIIGPGLVYKMDNWAFAFTTKGYANLDIVDVDTHIGDAITNAGLNFFGSTVISNDANQRLVGTTWGEIALSAAHDFYEDDTHKFSGGATVKLLFPGSYANFGADRFTGTVNANLGEATLTDASANLNIAYSGNLGEDFTEFSDYFGSLFGKPNGFAADFGVNYRWKDLSGSNKYRVNAGISVRNLGSMTFKSANNSATNYELSIQGVESLDLTQFEDVTSLKDIEQILLESGYLNRTENNSTDFKVTLPALFTAYADVRIIPDLFVTVFTQQKLNGDDANDQIATENVTSLTPRYLFSDNVEMFLPLSDNEISGFNAGLGFRAYGFFIGSSSIITAPFNDSNQADLYLGYSFGLR